ncbi:MAG: ABC transporter ATP-binding protein [Clostridia bacterium]|nr:ABC transporter ATP-binding protein [Clostridia bacterium]
MGENEREVLLDVSDLRKSFKGSSGRVEALSGVSFKVFSREIFGIVGESGSGKTTVGRIISGLYSPSSGSVRLGNEVIALGEDELGKMKRSAPTEYKRLRRVMRSGRAHPEIRMVFQDPTASLNPRMNVLEQVGEALLATGVRDKAEIGEGVRRAIADVGLPPSCLYRYPHEFSGGQRQRIGIARAIITKPRLLIADEPVSALDVSVGAQVINLIYDLARERGMSVIFIAHDLSLVRHVCDRVAVMYKGRIVELAESEELFRHPTHPYTVALLSAIPEPDPFFAKRAVRRVYEGGGLEGELCEVSSGHLVLMDG